MHPIQKSACNILPVEKAKIERATSLLDFNVSSTDRDGYCIFHTIALGTGRVAAGDNCSMSLKRLIKRELLTHL